jgi:N-acetylneuraminic acid mutarotase
MVAGGRGDGFGSAAGYTYTEMYTPATNTWTPRSPMPFARHGAASVVYSNRMYVLGGDIGEGMTSPQNSFLCYDPIADRWSALAPMPVALNSHRAEVVGNMIYVFGGRTGQGGQMYSDRICVYDILRGTWSLGEAMKTLRCEAASAVIGNNIYLAGGFHSSINYFRAFNLVEMFDTRLNTWLPGQR